MRKRPPYLGRSMALALTAAMALTGLPAQAAFAEDFSSDASDAFSYVEEPLVLDEAPVALAEEPVILEEEPAAVEELPEEDFLGDFSGEAQLEEAPEIFESGETEYLDETLEVSAIAHPTEADRVTPKKVSGIWLVAGENETVARQLRWQEMPNIDYYEFEVKDAAGHIYANGYDTSTARFYYEYYFVGSSGSQTPHISNVESFLGGLDGYNADGSVYGTTTTEDGVEMITPIKSMLPNQTYTIRIRAVNRYRKLVPHYNEEGEVTWTETVYEYCEGEWSDAVTYTAGNTNTPVSVTLAFAGYNAGEQILSFNAGNITYGSVRFEFAQDQAFSTGQTFSLDSYSRGANEKYYRFDRDAHASSYYDETGVYHYSRSFTLASGVTYYARAYHETNGEYLKDAEGNIKYSNVVSFQIPAEPSLKAIKNLRLRESGSSYFYFLFDATLEENDSYLLQYGKDPNFAEGSYTTRTDGLSIYKGNLTSGANYYVRAMTYRDDGSEGSRSYGTPSNVVTINKDAVATLGNISISERSSNNMKLSYKTTLNSNDLVEIWISEDSLFQNNAADKIEIFTTTDQDGFYLDNDDYELGKTYYVRARLRRRYDVTDVDGDEETVDEYGEFSNTVSFKLAMADLSPYTKVVGSTSITLCASGDGLATGYEFYRKVGKSYTFLAKSTDNVFTDTGLASDTEYTYRVRAYYVNSTTGKTTNGAWAYVTASTWGGNLRLKAVAASKTSVKLSWNKISGAQGYYIYKSVTSASGDTYSFDSGYNSNYKYQLVKTCKASDKTYTAKNLTAGTYASFMVVAFKTVNGQTFTIDASAGVSLGFGSMSTQTKRNADGSVTVSWSPVYEASGYLVERYDQASGAYVTYKDITSVKTASLKLPAASGAPVRYRFRAYQKGTPKLFSQDNTVTVSPILAAPTSVKAKANKNGSVTVTWKAVSGADFYRVYRTTSSDCTYNKDTKSYSYSGSFNVPYFKADATARSGYRKAEYDELTGTSLVDQRVSYAYDGTLYKLDGYDGPDPGVTYFYYVVAYKKYTSENSVVAKDSYFSGSASAAASALVTKVTAPAVTISSAKATKKGKLQVTWKKASGANGYILYRSTKKSKGYKAIKVITNVKTTKYTDSDITKGKTYYYKIRSLKNGEAGVYVQGKLSKAVSGKVKKSTKKK